VRVLVVGRGRWRLPVAARPDHQVVGPPWLACVLRKIVNGVEWMVSNCAEEIGWVKLKGEDDSADDSGGEEISGGLRHKRLPSLRRFAACHGRSTSCVFPTVTSSPWGLCFSPQQVAAACLAVDTAAMTASSPPDAARVAAAAGVADRCCRPCAETVAIPAVSQWMPAAALSEATCCPGDHSTAEVVRAVAPWAPR
jgi:hypothetical protein